ncbi:PLP-dependent cysteine synthase family protein [Streptomyces malaysiensis]|uniref:Cysteine synthase family protein n=1 Tax=Streptomyces malaysiensis subsp. samsunensis TaxID=459658 RepID=A0A9X2LXK0_STRMQ|nr:cysteine synthase family protein [Streptomyces samsunensis]MCQ8831293.1 cysteine synthase family protein [Streptomyces samsunensis]WPB90730.1 cysteine synthase family protein [Streptomyces malaysiensis]
MNTPLTTDLGILRAVGNTPLIQLHANGSDGGASVFVKLEYLNPSGSVKDRMTLAILDDAERRGQLKPGMTVVEYTGGSTGPALALACRAKGYPLKLVTSSCFTPERLAMMAAFGADLEVMPRRSPEGMTQEDVADMTNRVAELASLPDYFSTDQFHNQAMVEGYRQTLGQEILNQTGGRMTAFCTGVGTGGTLMGVGLAIKETLPDCQVVAMEPAGSPALSKGVVGPHKLQGLSGGKSPLVDMNVVDSVETAGDDEAIAMAASLAKTDGIFAGISTGANVVVARRLAERLGPDDVVVTIAVDSGMKYMSTGIFG